MRVCVAADMWPHSTWSWYSASKRLMRSANFVGALSGLPATTLLEHPCQPSGECFHYGVR